MPAVVYVAPLRYQPAYEAISKEIRLLQATTPGSRILTVPPYLSPPWSRDDRAGVRTVHPAWLMLRRLAQAATGPCDLIHVLTPLPLPRRIRVLLRHRLAPVVVTAISYGGQAEVDRALLGEAAAVVTECKRDRQALATAGVPATSLHLIYPASDLTGAITDLPPATPLRIVFASSPLRAAEASARGIDRIVAAARQLADVQFQLLWRPGAESVLAKLPRLPNLLVDRTIHADLTPVLSNAHAVVAPFRSGVKSKSVPLSILDALSCGRPVIVSDAVGLADFVRQEQCGVVIGDGERAFTDAVIALRDNLTDLGKAARAVGDRFRAEPFQAAYRDLYAAISGAKSPIPDSFAR